MRHVKDRNSPLPLSTLAWKSFRFWWRAHLAVSIGLVTSVAVLVGALVLGDSLQASLTELALRRLGPVGIVIRGERFLPVDLVEKLTTIPGFAASFRAVVPVLILEGGLRFQKQGMSGQSVVAGQVQVIVCDHRFWKLDSEVPRPTITPSQALINVALARRLAELSAGLAPEPGDRLFLRVDKPEAIPAESLLGNRRDTPVTLSLVLGGIVPSGGMGDFTLQTRQLSPLTVFIPFEALLADGWEGKCNAILLVENAGQSPSEIDAASWLENHLQVDPEVVGLRIEEAPKGYYLITYDGYIFPPWLERIIERRLVGLTYQPVLTYLANKIAFGDRFIPYSLVSGVKLGKDPPFGPLVDISGDPVAEISPGTIVLNDWAAEDLGVKVGEIVRLEFFLPESGGTKLQESAVDLRVAGIVKLDGLAADPLWTPQIPGVTEKESIRDWDVPFEPFHPEWIRTSGPPGPGNDEDYWHRYGTTPKAFIALETARQLWASRFGQTTGFRVAPGPNVSSVDDLRQLLRLSPSEAGLRIETVRAAALQAARGGWTFVFLFLAFSGFVLAAGIILAILFVYLAISQRAGELGTLMALGFTTARVRQLIAGELAMTVTVATVAGIAVGALYAAGIIHGLHAWWLPVVGEPLVSLRLRLLTLALGGGLGFVTAGMTVAKCVRDFRAEAPAQLLRAFGPELLTQPDRRTGRAKAAFIAAGIFLLSATMFVVGSWTEGSAQQKAVWFFGSAICLLVAGALIFARCLRRKRGQGRWLLLSPLWGLAWVNIGRSPRRSLATSVIVALAVFLLVAVSVFRLEPSRFLPGQHPGSGGFAFLVQCALPVVEDLSDPQRKADWFAPVVAGRGSQSRAIVDAMRVSSFRVRTGEDASCLNLYRPRQPTLLGVPKPFIDRGGFRLRPWVSCTAEEKQNPWRLLSRSGAGGLRASSTIPAIVDETTALYALGLSPWGDRLLAYVDSSGRQVTLEVVAVLQESIFQGCVLVAEKELLRLYPYLVGYQLFLVELSGPTDAAATSPPWPWGEVRALLEEAFVDYGAQVESTSERLARYAQVQNTYLAIFQSLGSLGLLLGALGLGAVQLRNVFERRREFALLQALGFPRRRLVALLLAESLVLALAGLVLGIIPAGVAVLPSLLAGEGSLPWQWLGLSVALTLFAGLVASVAAVGALFRIPFLQVLRRE
ncbi:MAG: ABC transporter permease [Thermoguttaceae bacterium]|nr:ABC transporter permease [Thermoguttaceae bacterium]